MIPVIINPLILEILIPWMKTHEEDIAMGISDFGELKPIYEALFMEQAQQKDSGGSEKECPRLQFHKSFKDGGGWKFCPFCGISLH